MSTRPRKRIATHPKPSGRRKRVNKAGKPVEPNLSAHAVVNSLQAHICVLDKAGVTFARSDGTKFPGEVSSAVFENRHGEHQTSMVIRDVSARKRLELALQQSEEKFHTIADFTCDWETWIAPDGRYIFASPSCERLTGYRADEYMAHPKLLARITHREDRERIRNHFQQFNMAGLQETVFRLTTRGGEVRWIEHICQPVYSSTGEFVGRRASNRDITERKRIEEELASSREQLRELAVHIESAREQERAHTAHEIHDQLAQDLTRLKMDLTWINRSLAGSSAAGQKIPYQERLAIMIETVDTLLHSVQRIATGLRPVVLDSLGFRAALEWQARDFEERTGIRCKTMLPEADPVIGSKCSTALFRILQEALTNVARHAAATLVKITLASGDTQFTLKIQDNGCGFRPKSLPSRICFGLLGMSERARALGGTCIIESGPRKGTTIETRIPRF